MVKEHAGRRFRFFESDDAVLVCGGIGAQAARRATEAVIALYAPALVCSAGFAGALDPALRVGEIVVPRRVVDASDGSSVETGMGEGVLISYGSVADPQHKAKLRESYGALAVDMEAAAVARAAEARGVRFVAVKAISDKSDFVLPPMGRFTSARGEFSVGRFLVFAAIRPWTWGTVAELARNSRRASHALCDRLRQMIQDGRFLHPGPAVPVEALNRK